MVTTQVHPKFPPYPVAQTAKRAKFIPCLSNMSVYSFSFSLKMLLRHRREHSNWGAELSEGDRRTVRASGLKQNIHVHMRLEGERHTHGRVVKAGQQNTIKA